METNTTQEGFLYTSLSVKSTTNVILMDECVSYLSVWKTKRHDRKYSVMRLKITVVDLGSCRI